MEPICRKTWATIASYSRPELIHYVTVANAININRFITELCTINLIRWSIKLQRQEKNPCFAQENRTSARSQLLLIMQIDLNSHRADKKCEVDVGEQHQESTISLEDPTTSLNQNVLLQGAAFAPLCVCYHRFISPPTLTILNLYPDTCSSRNTNRMSVWFLWLAS